MLIKKFLPPLAKRVGEGQEGGIPHMVSPYCTPYQISTLTSGGERKIVRGNFGFSRTSYGSDYDELVRKFPPPILPHARSAWGRNKVGGKFFIKNLRGERKEF